MIKSIKKFFAEQKVKSERKKFAKDMERGVAQRGRSVDSRVSRGNKMMLAKQWLRQTGKQLTRPLGGTNGAVVPEARLFARKIGVNGDIEDLGIVSTKMVTTAFANYMVDALQSSATDISLFNNHASGTSSTAEAIGDTALGAQSGSRVAGTQTEGAAANIYRTVATLSYTATLSIVEHGIFSALTGGTMMDRSVFASIGVTNGESIEFTYELTVPAGG